MDFICVKFGESATFTQQHVLGFLRWRSCVLDRWTPNDIKYDYFQTKMKGQWRLMMTIFRVDCVRVCTRASQEEKRQEDHSDSFSSISGIVINHSWESTKSKSKLIASKKYKFTHRAGPCFAIIPEESSNPVDQKGINLVSLFIRLTKTTRNGADTE